MHLQLGVIPVDTMYLLKVIKRFREYHAGFLQWRCYGFLGE